FPYTTLFRSSKVTIFCPGISNDTSLTATTWPNRLLTCSSLTGAPIPVGSPCVIDGPPFPWPSPGPSETSPPSLASSEGRDPPAPTIGAVEHHVQHQHHHGHGCAADAGQACTPPDAAVADPGHDQHRGQVGAGRHQEDDLADGGHGPHKGEQQARYDRRHQERKENPPPRGHGGRAQCGRRFFQRP